MARAIRPWWGDGELGPVEGRSWQIGPLTLHLARRPNEWRVGWKTGADPLADDLQVAEPLPVDAPEHMASDLVVHRFAMRGGGRFHLTPALADRPVVVRPDLPLHIPAGMQARVYVSSPVWLRVEVEGLLLTEVPTFRMSDTWFGASTRVGELCYASRTSGRLRLELLPRRHARAVTAVNLVNRASKPLMFERLKLPAPSLALFHGPEGLWTQSLAVTWTSSGTTDVELGPPPDGAPEQIADPRAPDPGGALARAFGALIR